MPVNKMFASNRLKISLGFLMLAVMIFFITASVIASSEPDFGNIDGLDEIDVRDVRLAIRQALELQTLTLEQQELADVNNDGVIDISDVVLIMRKAIGLESKFLVEDAVDEEAYIIVSLYHDQINGYAWPEEEELTIKVGTLEEKIVTEDDGSFVFRHEDLDIKPGQTVVVSTGGIRKVHIIRDINITSIDSENDIIKGTVEAGSMVEVRVFDPEVDEFGDYPARFSVSSNISRWTANFSAATGVDEAYQDAYDIEVGDRGEVRFIDLTNDVTIVYWECQEATFTVVPEESYIYGGGWAPVSEITVTIGDNEYTTISAPIDGFFFIGDLTVEVGDLVVVSDSVTAGEHEVTDLTIELVNSETKVVIGSATPASEVTVYLQEPAANYGPPIEHDVKTVITDTEGTWTTAFTVEEITDSMVVQAVQYDENNNSTVAIKFFEETP